MTLKIEMNNNRINFKDFLNYTVLRCMWMKKRRRGGRGGGK